VESLILHSGQKKEIGGLTHGVIHHHVAGSEHELGKCTHGDAEVKHSFVFTNLFIRLLPTLLTIFLVRDKMELVVLRQDQLHVNQQHGCVHQRKEPVAGQDADASEQGVQVHLPWLVPAHLF
jgi:hypothetical protein